MVVGGPCPGRRRLALALGGRLPKGVAVRLAVARCIAWNSGRRQQFLPPVWKGAEVDFAVLEDGASVAR